MKEKEHPVIEITTRPGNVYDDDNIPEIDLPRPSEPEPTTDPVAPSSEPVSFSATYNQKRQALRNALDPIVVKDEEGNDFEEEVPWYRWETSINKADIVKQLEQYAKKEIGELI